MPSDYDRIRAENLIEYGQGTRHLAWLGKLYADRTHFVFELLQNAEDAGATSIHFDLHPDRLEVRHDGRPFNEADVRGICGVGYGTKADDLTQIGKFGIGFKSVYAYTAEPEIHSDGGPDNQEHFRIELYVRPHAAQPADPGQGWTTLLKFPFDETKVAADHAYDEIRKRLRNLSARTLLFLRSIKEIEYRTAHDVSGQYVRETETDGSARRVTVVGNNQDQDEFEEWLVFARPVQPEVGGRTVHVEAAFKLIHDEQSVKIDRIPDSPLVVFFPTDKETYLGFLIQGPYRTTPARDNIPIDDAWNEQLVNETAALLVESLPELRDRGLLTVDLLRVLPINQDRFPRSGMFRPLYKEVRNALIHQPLLPTEDGLHLPAHCVRLGRGAELRRLLSPEQLARLYAERPDDFEGLASRQLARLYIKGSGDFERSASEDEEGQEHEDVDLSGSTNHWLPGVITPDNMRDLYNYLYRGLDIDELTPERFARYLTKQFLEEQSDDWMASFYAFLRGQEALWRYRYGDLRSKPFIRLENGDHVTPFADDVLPNVYLPTPGAEEYPTVRRSILQNADAAEFLRHLGLRRVERQDLLATVLDKWYRSDGPVPDIDLHLQHMQDFVDHFKQQTKVAIFVERNHRYRIFLDLKAKKLCAPEECYIDDPYLVTNLRYFFDGDTDTRTSWRKRRIWDGYAAIDGFADFAVEVGVTQQLAIVQTELDSKHPDWKLLRQIFQDRRDTEHGTNKNYFIPDLQSALNQRRIEVSKVVWEVLRHADSDVLQAEYSPNGSAETRGAPSSLVYLLQGEEWIPSHDGKFRAPPEMTIELLPNDFVYDNRNGWLDALGFGENSGEVTSPVDEEDPHAKALGINREALEFAREIQDDLGLLSEFRKLFEKRRKSTAFPERPVTNPDRRQERMQKRVAENPSKVYEPRTRNVRVSAPGLEPRTVLRNLYTNDDEEMVCQICQREMPFKKRDGEYYFEAVEVLDKQQLSQEDPAQFLALCPVCAAKYKEFIKNDPDTMVELASHLAEATTLEIALMLGDELATVRFVETHLLDLQTIVQGPNTTLDGKTRAAESA